MFEFSRIVKNCDKVFSDAAAKTRDLGRPTVGWDNELKQVVRTWPDGRKEIVNPSENSQLERVG
jgi:hypothetical protein|tara:strand:- start:3974 stop:4165 length:192 start_codon:yes stop_codon:yes gene_type:complete